MTAFGLMGGYAAASSAATAATTAATTAAIAVLRFAANVALQYAIGTLANSLLSRPQRRDGSSDSLIGLPVNNTDAGAPRVWAIGYRVRVPAQVMWQQRKVRESNPTAKGKSAGITLQHVTFDLALMLNDRLTSRMVQFIANDSLLTWDTLNLVAVRSANFSLSESGGQVTVSMSSSTDPDLNLSFDVGDMVELSGFIVNGVSPDPNSKYWEVVSISGHTSTASSMVIEPRDGQATAGLDVTSGTVFSPAFITRIDDAVVSDSFTLASFPTEIEIQEDPGNPANHPLNEVFRVGEQIKISDSGSGAIDAGAGGSGYWDVTAVDADSIRIFVGSSTVTGGFTSGTATDAMKIEFYSQPTLSTNHFDPSFVPSEHYYEGNESQGEDATIVAEEGSGNVGGFRGTAYQVIPDFDATDFGGAMPPLTEALLEVDPALNWQEAIRLVCERHGLNYWSEVDTTGVTAEPFLGMYIRGPTTGVQALQQLLLVKQIATQDRNGTVCFFEIDNADQVSVQNGSVFSDFGAAVGQPSEEKVSFGMVNEEELPTSVGIRFQDPDSGYGTNYEHFGLRHPSAGGAENRQELSLENVVLTRKDARNLAATITRRARINSRTVAFTLPASYLHVLENDLLSFTDDEGETHLVRVTRVDKGTNFLVQVQAVVERANITVAGSPVQTAAGASLASLVVPAELDAFVIDSPPVLDEWGVTPGIHVGCCAKPGSSWAGATLYMSQDSGASWQFVDTIHQEHAVGVLDSALATATASETLGSSVLTWDTTNTVDVELSSAGPLPLQTLTEQDVIEGWNWFGIVENGQVVEVFGARDVVANTSTNYTLSHLLRGIRGTWQGCAIAHSAGTQVVGLPFFYPLSATFVPIPGISMHAHLDFKFVVPGKDLATTNAVGITTRRRNVEPFALRDISKSYDSSNSEVTFTVDHWSRTNLAPGSTGPYPLDEPYEAYRFTLYDSSGNTAIYSRTKTAQGTGSATLRDAEVTFTNSELNTAGYTGHNASTTFWIDVQQIGQYATSPSILQQL